MRLWVFIFALLCALPAQAHVLPDDNASQPSVSVVDSYKTTRLAVTVYPNDLAMVTEMRRIELPAGRSEIRFHDVTDMIIPETAVLQSFEGMRIEGNFNSDLISKGALLQKAVGEVLTIRRLNPVTGDFDVTEAELVSASAPGNNIQGAVFKTDAGVEALQCSGLAESVLFSNIPDGLNPVPVLSVTVSAQEAGSKDITLTYLTRGIGWEADYRMDVKEGVDEAQLLGWLTMSNDTSKNFENADVAVVAGQVNRAAQSYRSTPGAYAKSFSATCGDNIRRASNDEIIVTARRARGDQVIVQEASSELVTLNGVTMERAIPAVVKTVSVREATRENLGDYKLYRAPQSVSLRPYQTKQIAFLLKPNVEFEPVHKHSINAASLRGAPAQVLPTRIEYEVDNSKDGNLARPLPAGTVRVMSEREDGKIVFIGEDKARDLAVDLPFDIKIGESFLVTTAFDYAREYRGDDLHIKLMSTVFNASDKPAKAIVDFDVINPEHIASTYTGAGDVLRDPDEASPTYRFNVPAQSKETLYVEIPAVAGVSIAFDRNAGAKPAREITTKYRYRDGGYIEGPLSDLLRGLKSDTVRFEATKGERVDIGAGKFELTQTFTFENLTAAPVKIDFFIEQNNRSGVITLVSSSLPPNVRGAPIWRFTLPANSSRELTATTRALKQ